MNKVIVYGFENNKLWFGRVTLWSWLYAFFHDGGFLKVKPIKGYEEYAYYKKGLCTELSYCKITNFSFHHDPLWAIAYAERNNGGLQTTTPIH